MHSMILTREESPVRSKDPSSNVNATETAQVQNKPPGTHAFNVPYTNPNGQYVLSNVQDLE